MITWLRNFLPLIFLLLTKGTLVSQILDTRHFKIGDGTAGVRMSCLFKDHEGYIYAGTSHGVYKFDGVDFIEIPFAGGKPRAVTSIFEDNNNRLWAGSQNGDIATLVNGSFQLFSPEEGTPRKAITHFLQDKQNNMWFSTDGEGIYYLYKDRLYNISTDDGLCENNVYTMELTEDGKVLAGTDQGMSICEIAGSKKTVTNLNSKNGLPDNYIKVIKRAGNNRYWIGMQDKGVCLYDNTTKQFSTPAFFAGWRYGQVNSILVLPASIWIATESNGVLREHDFNYPVTPANFIYGKYNNINDLLADNEGNIWVVTNANELIKTAGEQLKLPVRFDANTFGNVHAILCDRGNNIWYGSKSGIIKHGRASEQKFFIKELNEKTDITSLYQDAYDNIWIGTMGKGVFILDPASGRYKRVSENKLLQNGSVLSITGRDDDVFISSLEGAAAFTVYGNDKPGYKVASADFSNITGIGSTYIYTIFKDSKGRVWFATDGKGITVFQNQAFTNYNASSGLKDEVVYSITEDLKGNIWFSTHNAGVYKFDGKTFTNYSTFNGLSDVNISAVKTDRFGNIVIIYKKSIDVLNPDNGQVFCINENMGIREINTQDLGTVAQDTSGGVLVSTAEGIICYQPSEYIVHQPQTILESVQLFLTNVNSRSGSIFNHDENYLTFSFSGLYYSDPEAVRYKYKLEPYNSDWIITKDKAITFPQLPPGNYTFHVLSFVNEIFSKSSPVTFSFVIKKPFWKTAWFAIAAICIIAGILYWYIKLRERRLKKIEHLQQEKIQFRFETLRNQVNPHFLFNSFNTLISTIEDNPKMAVEYVEQLSEFFRNIVNYRDKDIISLEEEIHLLQAYSFIQQKRFGQNLQLNIVLTAHQKKEIFIPPLTLQLLAENAIKHNAVSRETPLIIDMFIKDETLFFRNNINPKITKPAGTGMGLQNIINRYTVLTNRKVIVQNDHIHFTISLPVIKKYV